MIPCVPSINKRISYIVPVYNASKFLPRCLDSILACMGIQDELILVDDGSTDSSGSVCDSYEAGNANIIKVIHQKNGGECNARNRGIAESTGEWIFFVDADDYLDDNCMKYFEKLDQNQDIILFAHLIDDEKKILVQKKESNAVYKFTNEQIQILVSSCFRGGGSFNCKNLFNPRSVWGKMFRRELIEKNQIRFHEEIFVGEDFEFVLECLLRAQNVEVIDRVAYHYFFCNEDSITNKYKPNLVMNTVNSRKMMIALLKEFTQYQSDYENYLLDMLILHLRDDFFHPSNHMRWKDKKKYISNAIDQGEYKRSYEIARKNKKIYHYTLGKRMMFWVMVNKKYCAMWIAYCIRYKLLKRGV